MMKNGSKLLIAVICLFMIFSQTSCIDGNWVRGNGKVEKQERKVASFSAISASNGLDVFLTQGENEMLTVQADENLMDIIVTEVKGNTLFIKATENIRRAKSRKVYVTFSKIDKIDVSSGSDVVAKDMIKADVLDLDVSSGADLNLWVKASQVSCSVSSGADAVMRGETDSLRCRASSGSDFKGKGLKTRYCEARASSGGDVVVFVEEELKARASSGGDVVFYGNPTKVDKNSSSGGDVNRR